MRTSTRPRRARTTGAAPAALRTLAEPVTAPAVRRRPRRLRPALLQLVLVLAGVAVYFLARGLTEADPTVAVDHAHDVVALEQRLGIYVEPELQRSILGHDRALDVANWIYIWGHWPVIAVVLLWLLRRHPSAYAVQRNALVLSGLVGVVVFVLYPVAPPRLAGLGLLDSVTARSQAYRVLQPPAFVNQYAAIPSLHVGWDLLMGLALVRCGRTALVRLIGVLLPVAMVAAVVLTANHFVLDAVIGAAVALLGLLVAERLAARSGTARSVETPDSGVPLIPQQRQPEPDRGALAPLLTSRSTTSGGAAGRPG